MFLPREKKILTLLLKRNDKLTTSQIAADLGVSTRTVKSDIKRINEELEEYSCSVQTKQGSGLWLDLKDMDRHSFELLLYEERDSYMSADVRKYYVACEMLQADGYTSMEAIADKLYVSKGTIVNDLNELESFWKEFDLTFTKKVKYGIKIEGKERKIRLALVQLLKMIAGKKEKFSTDRISKVLRKTDLDIISEAIIETEKSFQFILTDVSFDEFLLQLAVLINRLKSGNEVQGEAERSFEEEHPTDEMRRIWFIVQFIIETLEKSAGIEIPDSETPYLVTCLQGLKYQIPIAANRDKASLRARNPKLFDDLVDILRDADKKYELELSVDDEMLCSFFEHVECMIYRLNNKMFITNPLMESVKKEMFYEYEIALYIMSLLARKYNIRANEDEIGYITFYIGASIERMKQRSVVRVSIICMTGIGTSQFISVKLKRTIPNLIISKVLPANRAHSLKEEDQDFVISTVPLNLPEIDVVNVTPVLNEKDLNAIKSFIKRRNSKRIEASHKYPHLKALLNSNITILNCDLRSKEEVLGLLGGRMVSEGYVDSQYVSSVLARELVSETAIGNLIAIPHAFEGHIIKQGIGLMTLQKPISWGEERVQIVFMIALDPKQDGNINLQSIFADVLDLTSCQKDIDKLIKAKKFGDMNVF